MQKQSCATCSCEVAAVASFSILDILEVGHLELVSKRLYPAIYIRREEPYIGEEHSTGFWQNFRINPDDGEHYIWPLAGASRHLWATICRILDLHELDTRVTMCRLHSSLSSMLYVRAVVDPPEPGTRLVFRHSTLSWNLEASNHMI